jgi:hypothetical protein
MVDHHQVKVDDPFTGLFGFHPVAISVSDDDEQDDHTSITTASSDNSISSSFVEKSQLYIDSIRDDFDRSFYNHQDDKAWTPILAEAISSISMTEQMYDLICNNNSNFPDLVPSTAPMKEVKGPEASAPSRGRRRSSSYSKKDNQDQERRLLQPCFKPSGWDVICLSKKKQAYDHIGNRRMRLLVANNLKRYLETPCRLKKSQLIRSIVDQIYEASPEAGFVQMDNDTGCWYAVDREIAHDKVGHSFRDYAKKSPNVRKSQSSAAKEERKEEMSLIATQDQIFQGMNIT